MPQILSLIAIGLLTIGLIGWLITLFISWMKPERTWLPALFASLVGVTSPVLSTVEGEQQILPFILIGLIVLFSWWRYRGMWVKVGFHEIRIGQLDRAIESFKKAISRSRRGRLRSLAYIGLTTAHSTRNEFDTAIECALAAVSATTSRDILCVAHASLCALHWVRRDLDKTIEHGEAALATESRELSKFSEVSMFLASAYAEKGMVDKTKEIVKLMPSTSAALTTGLAFLRSGKSEEAISLWEEALRDARTKPYECNIRINLAAAYARAGQLDRSVMECRKVLELGPTEKSLLAMAYNNLAYAFALKNENLDEAERFIRKALDLGIAEHRGTFLGTLGIVLMQRGAYHDAIATLRDSLSLSENRPEVAPELVHFYLGQAYICLGQKEEARAELEKAVALDKRGITARLAREFLAKLPNLSPRPPESASPGEDATTN